MHSHLKHSDAFCFYNDKNPQYYIYDTYGTTTLHQRIHFYSLRHAIGRLKANKVRYSAEQFETRKVQK